MAKTINIPLKKKGERDCARMFPEFCTPILENLWFLIADYEFKEPSLKRVSRECWVTFKHHDVEIEIGYEPLTLPWGYVTKSMNARTERVTLDESMDYYGFHPEELKYQEYDEARNRVFAAESPREADEYASNLKEVFAQAVAERIGDIASFLRRHLRDILS